MRALLVDELPFAQIRFRIQQHCDVLEGGRSRPHRHPLLVQLIEGLSDLNGNQCCY